MARYCSYCIVPLYCASSGAWYAFTKHITILLRPDPTHSVVQHGRNNITLFSSAIRVIVSHHLFSSSGVILVCFSTPTLSSMTSERTRTHVSRAKTDNVDFSDRVALFSIVSSLHVRARS